MPTGCSSRDHTSTATRSECCKDTSSSAEGLTLHTHTKEDHNPRAHTRRQKRTRGAPLSNHLNTKSVLGKMAHQLRRVGEEADERRQPQLVRDIDQFKIPDIAAESLWDPQQQQRAQCQGGGPEFEVEGQEGLCESCLVEEAELIAHVIAAQSAPLERAAKGQSQQQEIASVAARVDKGDQTDR